MKQTQPVSFTREQLRLIDRLCVERYEIPSILLMENAGRGAAEVIHQTYGPKPPANGPASHSTAPSALILCGTGNNGGDGCVIARHLHNSGWEVQIVVVGDLNRAAPDMKTNWTIAWHMGLLHDSLNLEVAIDPQTVVIDALLGTGFSGEVREPIAGVIQVINGLRKRAIIAIDLPSGIDCDSGIAAQATIRADLTISFVGSKKGFENPHSARFTGSTVVIGISAPRELMEAV